MEMPLLQTKLYIPQLRPNLIPRPRLIERLNEGLHRSLTLISAPAGFGKTTLIIDWLRQIDLPAGWLSLDEGDNDLARFLTYFIAALQQIEAEFGQTGQELVRSPQLPSPEALMISLINDMATFTAEFVLVLDDYHVIDAQPVHEALTFLVQHIPPQMHLIITGRADPPLPLSRLRARSQMTELRADDLRFTTEEAAAFLNEVTRSDLSEENVTTLKTRTEGWIAGLQLAALSMQGTADIQAFISAFAGDDRYIMDYLVEEVLHQWPEDTQLFLLQTSILERMTGPLVDAMTGREDSQSQLQKLEQANLFIVPLDNQRRWYRYHHLFADLLRRRLHQTQPDQIQNLHRRASAWFAQEGLIDEAVIHALATEDFEQVASLIEQDAQIIIWEQGNMRTLLKWLAALSPSLIRSRPRLSITYAWVLFELFTDQERTIESFLQDAEAMVKPTDKMAADEQVMLGEVHLLRANLARRQGQTNQAIHHARQALEYLPQPSLDRADNVFVHAAALYILGAVYDSLGNLVEAGQHYSESIALIRATGLTYGLLAVMARLIEVLIVQSQLHKGERVFQQMVQAPGKQQGPDVGMAYVGMGEICREWNDLKRAAAYLEKGIKLCRPFETWRMIVLKGMSSLAWVRQAQGDVDGVSALLQEMERLEQTDLPYPLARPAADRARLWLAQGNLGAAARWAQESGLSLDDELSYLHEIDHLTLARILIAQNRPADALYLLERLHRASQDGGRLGRVIEIQILQALAHQAQGDMARALPILDQALSLAKPENYIRVFVDEGEPMVVLLHEAARQAIAAGYVNRLLEIFKAGEQGGRGAAEKKADPSPLLPRSPAPPLLDPLTGRELDTLRLLATELSIPEIAEEMMVAVSTTRSHVKSIYSKLNVHSRLQAIQRAKVLGLL